MPLTAQIVRAVQTTVDLSKAMVPLPTVTFGKKSSASPLAIAVDDRTRFQTIDGLGAAFAEGSAYLLRHELTVEQCADIMAKLFLQTQGIGLSAMRMPIA